MSNCWKLSNWSLIGHDTNAWFELKFFSQPIQEPPKIWYSISDCVFERNRRTYHSFQSESVVPEVAKIDNNLTATYTIESLSVVSLFITPYKERKSYTHAWKNRAIKKGSKGKMDRWWWAHTETWRPGNPPDLTSFNIHCTGMSWNQVLTRSNYRFWKTWKAPQNQNPTTISIVCYSFDRRLPAVRTREYLS